MLNEKDDAVTFTPGALNSWKAKIITLISELRNKPCLIVLVEVIEPNARINLSLRDEQGNHTEHENLQM